MTTFRATLTCKHVVDIEADGVHTATSLIGAKQACPKCPAKADGDQPARTVKLVRFDDEPETIREAAGEAVRKPVGSRMERLERAKEAAANGGDVAAVLSEPVADNDTETAPRRRGRQSGRRTFLNLSPVRVEALKAAGFDPARLDGKTVDLSQADVDQLLDGLAKVCGDDNAPARNAACRVAGWLEKFRSQI